MTSPVDRCVRWLPVALVCGAGAWVVARAARPISDPDDWWHLRLGQQLIDQHSLSTPAHWSSFATVAWVPTEPLPEIVSALVQRWLGLPGLAWLFGLAALGVLLTVYVVNRREAATLPAAVATLGAVLAASGSLTSRPQLVSFVLLPVLLGAWLRSDRDLRPRWWLIPLVWFWSLCHGFWIIGAGYGVVVLVGIAASRRATPAQLARLAGVAIGSVAVVALNPVGLGVLRAPFAVNSTAHFIQEWQRTDLLLPGPLAVAVMILATAGWWVATRTGVSWARVLVLLSAAFWLWYATRTVVVAGLVVAPLFAAALDGLVRRTSTQSNAGAVAPTSLRVELRLLVGWMAVLLVTLALLVPHTSRRPGDVPLALDPALDRLPPGTRVLAAYELGGWIRWRHPDLEQYIDGLITPFSEQHAQDYATLANASPGWRRILARDRLRVALVWSGSALAGGLTGLGWHTVGHDDGYVLMTARRST